MTIVASGTAKGASCARHRDTVLIFRLGSIGDTVIALPCFHAIAREFPYHRRVLLTNSLTAVRASSAESILSGTGLIDETIYYPVGDFSVKQILTLRRELKRMLPVALVYLAERPTAFSILRDVAFFKSAGVPKVIGGPWNKSLRLCRIDPTTSESEHEVERLARMLGKVMPVSLAPEDWDLRLSAAEQTKADNLIEACSPLVKSLIAIAPGAKISAKDWGPDRWEALLGALADDYQEHALVLVGAPDERALCEHLAARWSGPALNYCGLLTPRETAAVLRRCTLLVCHDSGPMHLAASQGTCCVALFGNYNRPRKWYPYGEGHRVIYEPSGIRKISVQSVADEIRSVVAGLVGFRHRQSVQAGSWV